MWYNFNSFGNKRQQRVSSFILTKGCASSNSSLRWLDFCGVINDGDDVEGLQWDMTSTVDISSRSSSRSFKSESSKLWLPSDEELSMASSTLVQIRDTGSISSQKYLKSLLAALRSRLLKTEKEALKTLLWPFDCNLKLFKAVKYHVNFVKRDFINMFPHKRILDLFRFCRKKENWA